MIKAAVVNAAQAHAIAEKQLLLQGKSLAQEVARIGAVDSLSQVEFRIFSQWGDDGIIQWLVSHLKIENKTFVEFGVENYRESNTRFLLMNDNWSGLVIDGSSSNINKIREAEYFWRYDLTAVHSFVTKDNINGLISSWHEGEDLGLLHIDIDGNDYWIWEEISVVRPILLILEYNSVFGADRNITVPYRADFNRTKAHYSNLYFGASLGALNQLSESKGYQFVGCNSAGNNAYFVRSDRLNEVVAEVGLDQGFVVSKMREGRDQEGRLTFLSGEQRLEAIRGLPVFNTDTGELEKL